MSEAPSARATERPDPNKTDAEASDRNRDSTPSGVYQIDLDGDGPAVDVGLGDRARRDADPCS